LPGAEIDVVGKDDTIIRERGAKQRLQCLVSHFDQKLDPVFVFPFLLRRACGDVVGDGERLQFSPQGV
jgi:hypothetical protein